jgi:hypothetical protein
MTKSQILAKYNLDIGTTYANPYADNQLVPVVDWLEIDPGYCPSLSDLSSITRNFVGSGGYGTWYFTFTYTGTTTATATIWYRTRRDGVYTPNQFYPPFRYTATFTPGSTHTLSGGSTESPGTYLEIEAFECNQSIIAPYVYYVNYDTEQGTTSGYVTACAYGPATYPVYTNASSLSGIISGSIIYQNQYGYPYYAGGVNRWLAIGETEDGSVTYGLELNPNAAVIQTISCATTPLPTTYYSTPQSGTATRNNCSEGYTGSTVTLSVIANGYSSTISVEDANNQAIAYINANKQAYANANGTCTSTCAEYTIGTSAGYGTTTTYTDCGGTSQQVTIGGVNGFEAYTFCALYGSVIPGNETAVTYNGNCEDSTAVDCAVSGWSDWSECVEGSQTRTRTIITQPSNGGETCPVLSETQSCTGYVRISYIVNLQGGISPGGFEINTQAGNVLSTSYTDSGYVDVPYNSLITSTIYAPVGDTSSGQTPTFYTRVVATDNGGVIADSGVPTSNASSTINFYATSDVAIQADGTVNSNGGGGEVIQ